VSEHVGGGTKKKERVLRNPERYGRVPGLEGTGRIFERDGGKRESPESQNDPPSLIYLEG